MCLTNYYFFILLSKWQHGQLDPKGNPWRCVHFFSVEEDAPALGLPILLAVVLLSRLHLLLLWLDFDIKPTDIIHLQFLPKIGERVA